MKSDENEIVNKGSLGLIAFEQISHLKTVYEALKKHNKDILNERGEQIKLSLTYDKRCFGELKWAGVVLRNLPANSRV